MPELPEVETMVRELGAVRGARIRTARLLRPDVLKNVAPRTLTRHLTGATVRQVRRRAKNAVLHFDDRILVIQPGMTGSFAIAAGAGRRRTSEDDEAYTVLRLSLADGRTLAYRDVRRLGRMYLFPPAGYDAFSERIGPEPLDPSLTAEALAASVRNSRQAIKKVLMDQRRLAGVGNIYANEALFAAGIDPSAPASRLSVADYRRLLDAVRRILQAAIDAEGTTFRDYRTGSGQPGSFQFDLLVYGREGQPCRVCGTRLAATHTIDARVTVFCHRCQR
jgi:formamidopyrimidine-DNA glycosylase